MQHILRCREERQKVWLAVEEIEESGEKQIQAIPTGWSIMRRRREEEERKEMARNRKGKWVRSEGGRWRRWQRRGRTNAIVCEKSRQRRLEKGRRRRSCFKVCVSSSDHPFCVSSNVCSKSKDGRRWDRLWWLCLSVQNFDSDSSTDQQHLLPQPLIIWNISLQTFHIYAHRVHTVILTLTSSDAQAWQSGSSLPFMQKRNRKSYLYEPICTTIY